MPYCFIKEPSQPKKKSLLPTPTIDKKPMVAIAEVRYDGKHHWSAFEEKKYRCRVCSMAMSAKCGKC